MPSVIVAWKGSCRDPKIRNRLLGHLHRLAMQSDGYLRSGQPERPGVLNLVSEQRGVGLRPRANIETIDRPIPGSILVSSYISPSPEALIESAREAGLTVIDRQVAHMSRLIEDLLDVTRISRGKVELHRERFDLSDVVRGTTDDHRAIFAFEGVPLEGWIDREAVLFRQRHVQLAGDSRGGKGVVASSGGSASIFA